MHLSMGIMSTFPAIVYDPFLSVRLHNKKPFEKLPVAFVKLLVQVTFGP